MKLLHIEIENQLSLNQHIWKLCSKASMQLNVILMGNNEKIAMINSFVYSSFNCCPLVEHFCSCKSSQKIEKNEKRCLRYLHAKNSTRWLWK